MADSISTTGSIPAKNNRISTLALSRVENNNDSNNSNDETRRVKKTDEVVEKIVKTSQESVERTVQALKEYIESNSRSLQIQVHDSTGVIMVKVISAKDGKVIREMPPEKLLDLVANMEELAGSLFNESA
jgi:flagellar protein FlaG